MCVCGRWGAGRGGGEEDRDGENEDKLEIGKNR